MSNKNTLEQIAYESGELKTHLEMFPFEKLPKIVKECWETSGQAIASHIRETEVKPLREAFFLAQKWLCNCMLVVEIPGPKPLPVIAKALAAYQSTKKEKS